MQVKLSSRGNPDFGENLNKSMSPEKMVDVKDLKEASRVCIDYIVQYGLGGGNWTGGQVYQDGEQIAYVSYNGRIWEKDGRQQKEIIIE